MRLAVAPDDLRLASDVITIPDESVLDESAPAAADRPNPQDLVADRPHPQDLAADRPDPQARLAAARAALGRAELAAGLRTRLGGPGLSTSPALTSGRTDPAPVSPLPGAAPRTVEEPAAATDRTLPVPAALAPLFPGGAVARGSVVQVGGSTSVLLALAAAASQEGAWCALAAMPHIGWRAAAGSGLALDRVAVVPSPGPDAASVVGALTDGFDVLVVGRCPALSERDRRSIAARVRTRGAVLLSTHAWPGAHLVLRAARASWEGLGQGWGHLADQELTVRATGRAGAAGVREVSVRVGPDGLRAPAGAPVVQRAPDGQTAPLLRAV
ncbi:hypothetical protein [Georgenia subflava]|uniref:Uncharacterized protein n=1 Tax=Georgenia subflava TaxID=1622177 RepID=A0A6N7EKG6_9MICO|nr:hypothetical protein [Georgenia subflava]MPV35764.1 hypothetical protein [Georgenia subflava]